MRRAKWMAESSHAIGSGRPLFTLPGGRFYNATKPLEGRILDMTTTKYAMLAIRDGEVRGMCGIQDDAILRESVAEWALDPSVTAMLRVPVEVARKAFDATEVEVRDMLAALSPQP
jgi:hypothetical protein